MDLNAATIDRDARHNLTNRYEKLLSTFLADELELVETDSICLKVALEKYRIDGNQNEYMILAGVNYESYVIENEEEKVIPRNQKLLQCAHYVYSLITNKQVNNDSYTFLLPYVQHINAHKDTLDTDKKIIELLYNQFSRSFKILFKIKE